MPPGSLASSGMIDVLMTPEPHRSMTNALETPHAERGVVLLADISGYTAFLEAVAIAHPEMSGHGGPVPPPTRS